MDNIRIKRFIILLFIGAVIGIAFRGVPSRLFIPIFLTAGLVAFFIISHFATKKLTKTNDLKYEPDNKTIEKMNAMSQSIEDLGFIKEDEYYQDGGISQSYVYQFRHSDKLTYVQLITVPTHSVLLIMNIFGENHTLTTCNDLSSGVFTPPEGNFLQIFPKVKIKELYDRHLEGVRFMKERNYLPSSIPEQFKTFREFYEFSNKVMFEIMSKRPLWQLQMMFRALTGYGKRFTLPINEQYEKGMIKLPEKQ